MKQRGLEEITETEKRRRSAAGARILRDYRKHMSDQISSREEILTDILCDLMHLWARTGQLEKSTFTEIYQRAVDHNQLELGFEQEFDSFPGATNLEDSRC